MKNCRYLMLQHQTTLRFAVFHCLYSGATDVHRHNSCLNCCVAGGRPLSEPYAAELQQFDENLGNQPIVSNGLSSGHLIPRATDDTTILPILKIQVSWFRLTCLCYINANRTGHRGFNTIRLLVSYCGCCAICTENLILSQNVSTSHITKSSTAQLFRPYHFTLNKRGQNLSHHIAVEHMCCILCVRHA